MSNAHSAVPLNAWFTLRGDFVGVSGIPVQLAPGQRLDANAWYTADGRRAAVAGPFDNAYMNRQGYIRGAQILAAEKMQRAANQTDRTGAGAHSTPVEPQSGLKLLDWTSVTVGGTGAGLSLEEMEAAKKAGNLVRTGEQGIIEWWRSPKNGRWYSVKKWPNGITGPRGAVLSEGAALLKQASRFKVVGWGFAGAGFLISGYQGITAYNSTDPDRNRKMAKAGLDIAMGMVGLLGPVGFAIATVYFMVDTGIALSTNGEANILDIFFPVPRLGQGTIRGPLELLLVPADNTRVAPVPRRMVPRSLNDVLRQTSIAQHNAVFRPANR